MVAVTHTQSFGRTLKDTKLSLCVSVLSLLLTKDKNLLDSD